MNRNLLTGVPFVLLICIPEGRDIEFSFYDKVEISNKSKWSDFHLYVDNSRLHWIYISTLSGWFKKTRDTFSTNLKLKPITTCNTRFNALQANRSFLLEVIKFQNLDSRATKIFFLNRHKDISIYT